MKKNKGKLRGGQLIDFSMHARVKEGEKRKQKHNRAYGKQETRGYKGRRPKEVDDFFMSFGSFFCFFLKNYQFFILTI